ncbi:MAG TPA: metalloregulator ArsR/SmtB family transcription factor [Streptosporangiaceae bacterium]|jgi:DNA-binding transcriptional ArsR family regulator|nr:metalloregulator ArsR/SmtB family transcription factor [Streptosporangiaceae bacterium]
MIRYQPVWQTETVHLIPADRAGHRVIDGERVCQAIEALGDPDSVRTRAQYFAVLADPTRLALLTCIGAAGPISVSDLAVATGLHDTTISQALRYLRAAQVVSSERDGRVIRYQLADSPVTALLRQQEPEHRLTAP